MKKRVQARNLIFKQVKFKLNNFSKNKRMKTNITSVLLTGLKLTILSLIFISVNIKVNAQDELKRTYLKLYYTKNSDGSKSLTANISYKENRKFVAVKNEKISFYSGVDLDELIKTVKINSNGEAVVVVPEEFQADSLGFFYFAAKFKGTEIYKRSNKDLSIKDSRLELTFNQKSEGRTITVKAFEIKDEEEDLPLSEEDVYIFIPTLFGDMQIGKGSLEDGSCQIEFPSDLPGDSVGNLEIIVKIIDSDVYGDVVKTEKIPWGKPKSINQIEETNEKGKLWTYNAPLWMVITLSILLIGVWSHFGYVIYKMYKINMEGSEKAN